MLNEIKERLASAQPLHGHEAGGTGLHNAYLRDVPVLIARVEELEGWLGQVEQLAGAVAEHLGMTRSRLKLIRQVCARRALEERKPTHG